MPPEISSSHNLKRLFTLRGLMIAGELCAILGVHHLLDVDLPLAPLLGIVAMLTLANGWTWRKVRRGARVTDREFLYQLCIDVAAIAALLYFTGGATNPFAWLLLIPLIIAITVLSAVAAWLIAALSTLCYSLLMRYYMPLGESPHLPHGDSFSQHVFGMWFAFVLSACLIAWFVGGMARTLRQRDRLLADALRQSEATEAALQEADRRKDEFLATLGHELRNPLAPIRNAVEVLKLKGSADSAVLAAHDMIDRQVLYMVRLIDDLLDVSRITRGTLRLRKDRVELATVMRQAIEIERPFIARAGHELAVSLPSQPIFLDADPVRLAQVFSNLLNNAGKYMESGGCIRLGAERQGTEVVVIVADSGIGIPPDELCSIFDMFCQLQSGAEQSQSGLGVGLSLTRALVELHGGCITARSEGAGKGSDFIVRLPALDATTRRPVPRSATPAVRETVPCRVLVADDNRDAAESLAMLLRLHGNRVVTACNGVEAVDVARRVRPDLALLDLGMPRLDGYGACRRIRAQPWGKGMRIVAVTGRGQDSDRRNSELAGFDDHLVKPVAASAVLQLQSELQDCRAEPASRAR